MAKDNDSNEVEIDLDKYMALIEKLDERRPNQGDERGCNRSQKST